MAGKGNSAERGKDTVYSFDGKICRSNVKENDDNGNIELQAFECRFEPHTSSSTTQYYYIIITVPYYHTIIILWRITTARNTAAAGGGGDTLASPAEGCAATVATIILN